MCLVQRIAPWLTHGFDVMHCQPDMYESGSSIPFAFIWRCDCLQLLFVSLRYCWSTVVSGAHTCVSLITHQAEFQKSLQPEACTTHAWLYGQQGALRNRCFAPENYNGTETDLDLDTSLTYSWAMTEARACLFHFIQGLLEGFAFVPDYHICLGAIRKQRVRVRVSMYVCERLCKLSLLPDTTDRLVFPL